MNALQGMIGAPDAPREQTVWTPEWVLDAVDKVFPDGWGDAYRSPGSPASTRAAWMDPSLVDALRDDWYRNTYANPPYDTLREHIARARAEWDRVDTQTVMLCPIRTRRDWWCRAAEGASVAYLKPVAFIGHKNTHPENMATIYWGERKALFRLAFSPHSHHIQDTF